MSTRARIVLTLALVLLAGAAPVVMSQTAPGATPLAGGVPTVVGYQGEVRLSGTPYNGDGYFKFAVVDAAGTTTYWSNDGTSSGGGPPVAAVQLAVSEGLFSVLLGDTTMGGMTEPLTADAFGEPNCYLRVWFSTSASGPFDQLVPDTQIAAVPYALQAQEAVDADTVDGWHATDLVTHYQNVIVVAQSGGDYTSVQSAIDSITDASAGNPYLVWVAPGVYSETVTLQPFVHLQGAGQEATIIASNANSGAWPPDQATLVLASDTSLRDLTVQNAGAGDGNAALLATAGMTRTLAANVTARALGSGVNNFAIAVVGSPTRVNLLQVTALAESGSSTNIGVLVSSGADAVLHGGTFTAREGDRAWAAFASQSGTTLEASGVSMLAENASTNNTAIYPYDGAEVVLHGGDFTARGGLQTNAIGDQLNSTVAAYDVTALAEDGVTNYGLGVYDGGLMTVRGASVIARGGEASYAVNSTFNGAALDADNVSALAEGGSLSNYGLQVGGGNAQATVRGGSFTGHGGHDARGIDCEGEEITLDAEGVTALGEDGSDASYGLHISNGAAVTLYGGSLTGRGGIDAWGIHSTDSNTTLVAESVAVLGENGSTDNYGLHSDNGAAAVLHGGSFTARGGTWAKGIYSGGVTTTLEAEGVTALGEGGSEDNYGLLNQASVGVTLRGGSFTGRGGVNAYGIGNSGSGTWLEAESVTALAEDGTDNNDGLYNELGAATLRGGSYIARGGTDTRGIYNYGSGATLEAEGVSALAEDGGNHSAGLENSDAEATLCGGSYIARGLGTDAVGIYNIGTATLDTQGVTAVGEGASLNFGVFHSANSTADLTQSVLEGATYSVYVSFGSVTVSNSRLVGNTVSGTVTCVLVTRGTAISTDGSTCP